MQDVENSGDGHRAPVNCLRHQDKKGAMAQKNADRDHKVKIASRLVAGGCGNNHGERWVVRLLRWDDEGLRDPVSGQRDFDGAITSVWWATVVKRERQTWDFDLARLALVDRIVGRGV